MDTHDTNKAEDTIERVQTTAHETVDKVADATRQAADTLGQKSEQLKNAEQQLVEDCRIYINENPITTLTIAVGVGFLFSRMLSA